MTKPLKKVSTTTQKTAHHDTVGNASIPDREYFDSYISRKVSGTKSEFDIFDAARKNKFNVLIEGPTGPGKTSAVLAYAAREHRAFYAIPSNVGIEPSQLFGKFVPDGEGGFKWVDGPVTSLVRNGGVLLINEVNFMPERVATVLFGLLDKRRQIQLLDHEAEIIDAADDLLIVADMNPDYEGTRPLNKAFRNRFAIQLWWDYDRNVEEKLVHSTSMLDMSQRLRNDFENGMYSTPVSTNMLMEFEKMATTITLDFAVLNFVNHFPKDERSAVKLVVDTFKDNIETDLTPMMKEDVDPETGSVFPEGHPIWKQREEAPDGWVDPEWGVKSVEWVWDEAEDVADVTDDDDTI